MLGSVFAVRIVDGVNSNTHDVIDPIKLNYSDVMAMHVDSMYSSLHLSSSTPCKLYCSDVLINSSLLPRPILGCDWQHVACSVAARSSALVTAGRWCEFDPAVFRQPSRPSPGLC